MTQAALIVYLESVDCVIYREFDKDDGHHVHMRKNGFTKIGCIYPTNSGQLRAASVCQICNNLGVPVPEFGQHMQEVINVAKANCPKRID